MVQKADIESFLHAAKGHLIIDVRSPGEYEHAHIPGAINLPLFSNDERAAIGTLYKQTGRAEAMMLGLEYYGKNMQRILSELKNRTGDKQLFVHCWRGGMRSGVVAWMLDLFGYKVCTLNKGYKAFRRLVLDSFSVPKNILILGGKTGSAKTDTLKELAALNQQVIDLERMANHKGSAFGGLGDSYRPSQEQFENDLFMAFSESNPARPVWLEDESQRIGMVNLPNALWNQMRAAKVIYLEIPFEQRLDYLLGAYGNYHIDELKAATLRIQKRLGGLETKNTIQYLESGDIRHAFSILLKYYDKLYLRASSQRNPENVLKVDSTSTAGNNNARLLLKTGASLGAALSV